MLVFFTIESQQGIDFGMGQAICTELLFWRMVVARSILAVCNYLMLSIYD